MIRPIDNEGRAMSAPLRQPPAVVIRLELEERPVVFLEYFSDGDEARMKDWVFASEPLLDLVTRALALATAEVA